jgi:molecular chaperone GrpE (heat shock protein)
VILEYGNTGEGTGESESDTRLPVAIESTSNVEDTLRVLVDSVEELRGDFRRNAQGVDHQRVLLDKLHDENEQLRRAEVERSRDPVVRDLISLTDTCLRNGRAWEQRGAVTPGDVYRVLREVTDDVELILERQGVETFKPEQGASFDRREHRVVRSADTSDASLNGVIAEVLKPGYRMGNRIIRYCEVVVWAFVATPAGPADAEDISNSQ